MLENFRTWMVRNEDKIYNYVNNGKDSPEYANKAFKLVRSKKFYYKK